MWTCSMTSISSWMARILRRSDNISQPVAGLVAPVWVRSAGRCNVRSTIDWHLLIASWLGRRHVPVHVLDVLLVHFYPFFGCLIERCGSSRKSLRGSRVLSPLTLYARRCRAFACGACLGQRSP